MDTMLRRRAMIAAGGSPTPPPPTPTPVFYDYIIFDGTAYIETDIVPPADASFNVKMGNETLKSQQRLFLCNGTNAYFGALLSSNTSATKRYFAVYYGATTAGSSNQKSNNFSTAIYNFFLTPKRFGWGSTDSYTYTKGAGTPTGGLVIGDNTSHSGQAFTGEMQTFYVYDSDAQNCTKAADFSSYTPKYTLRPCTVNGEAGIWCEETSKFYGNTAGAGTLSVRNIS